MGFLGLFGSQSPVAAAIPQDMQPNWADYLYNSLNNGVSPRQTDQMFYSNYLQQAQNQAKANLMLQAYQQKQQQLAGMSQGGSQPQGGSQDSSVQTPMASSQYSDDVQSPLQHYQSSQLNNLVFGPDYAKADDAAYIDTSRKYIVGKGGQAFLTNGPGASSQPTLSEDGKTTYLPLKNGGWAAVATPGAAPVAASAAGMTTAATTAATQNNTPPEPGMVKIPDSTSPQGFSWGYPGAGNTQASIQGGAYAKSSGTAAGAEAPKPMSYTDQSGNVHQGYTASILGAPPGSPTAMPTPQGMPARSLQAPPSPSAQIAPPSRGVITTQSEAQKADLEKSRAELAAYNQAAADAATRTGMWRQLANLNPQVGNGGVLQPVVAGLHGLTASMGLGAGSLSPQQQYQGIVANLLKQQNPDVGGGSGGTGTSQNGGVSVRNLPEFNFIKSGLPDVKDTVQGRAAKIQDGIDAETIKQHVAAMAAKYAQENNGNLYAPVNTPNGPQNFHQLATSYIQNYYANKNKK